jgi:hypothetical protein
VLARRFAERYTDDERLLTSLELHDEPYWIWRIRNGDGRPALAQVLARLPDEELFLRFVELDASTEGKDPGLLHWLRDATAAPTRKRRRARGLGRMRAATETA